MKKYIKWFFKEHKKTYSDLTLTLIGLGASILWSIKLPVFAEDTPLFVLIAGSIAVYGFFIANLLQPYSIYKKLNK